MRNSEAVKALRAQAAADAQPERELDRVATAAERRRDGEDEEGEEAGARFGV